MQMELIELIKTFGIAVALLIFFVWQSSKEKGEITQRLRAVEEYCRTELAHLIGKNTEAMNRIARAVEEAPCGENLKKDRE